MKTAISSKEINMQTGESKSPARRRRSVWQRGQRGQSLVEFALSLSVLVLVFSGAIDLGRAFFIRINMDSMVGEGLHWAAAYPGCLPWGVVRNELLSPTVPKYCRGTNSVKGRMDQENNLLGTATWVSTTIDYVPQQAAR